MILLASFQPNAFLSLSYTHFPILKVHPLGLVYQLRVVEGLLTHQGTKAFVFLTKKEVSSRTKPKICECGLWERRKGFQWPTTTPNKEKKTKQNKSWEASLGLENLNRWQVESSYCHRFFFPPSKTTKRKCVIYLFIYYYFSFQKWGSLEGGGGGVGGFEENILIYFILENEKTFLLGFFR